MSIDYIMCMNLLGKKQTSRVVKTKKIKSKNKNKINCPRKLLDNAETRRDETDQTRPNQAPKIIKDKASGYMYVHRNHDLASVAGSFFSFETGVSFSGTGGDGSDGGDWGSWSPFFSGTMVLALVIWTRRSPRSPDPSILLIRDLKYSASESNLLQSVYVPTLK